jgi:hypothetical protein
MKAEAWLGFKMYEKPSPDHLRQATTEVQPRVAYPKESKMHLGQYISITLYILPIYLSNITSPVHDIGQL